MATRGFLFAMMVAAALAGGCKKKAAPAGEAMDPLVAEVHAGLTKYRDEMCACKDIACADQVQNALGQWIMKEQTRFTDVDKKSTPAQIAAAQKISAEHDACAKKLAGR
jgi:hypothetical protein